MKNKTSFFNNKLFIGIVLAVFIVSPFSAAVLAGKDYNSSKSNTFAISKLEDLGVDEAGIGRILDVFDDEIRAYAGYDDAMQNAIRVMREAGMNEEDIKRTLLDIGIDVDYIPKGSGDPLKGLNVYGQLKKLKKEISTDAMEISINGEKIKVALLDGETAPQGVEGITVKRTGNGVTVEINEEALRKGIVVLDDGGGSQQSISRDIERTDNGVIMTLSEEDLNRGIVVLDDGGGIQQSISGVYIIATNEEQLRTATRILDGSLTPDEVSGVIIALNKEQLRAGLSIVSMDEKEIIEIKL